MCAVGSKGFADVAKSFGFGILFPVPYLFFRKPVENDWRGDIQHVMDTLASMISIRLLYWRSSFSSRAIKRATPIRRDS